MKKVLTLNSPARIHIGFLDLEKDSLRKYGSLGLTVTKFFYKIRIESSNKLEIDCKNKLTKSKILKIIDILKKENDLSNFKISVCDEIPAHNGLGSGTQLALSVGYLIAEFNKLKLDINQLAFLFRRGRRSGIGIECFKKGGFNIDAGKLKGSIKPPLSIFNMKWPKDWKILLILDKNLEGLHGKKEVQEFKELKKIHKNKTNLNCKSLLMNIIPGLIEKNFEEFTKGIRAIQDMMSETFYGKRTKYASISIEKIFKNLNKKGIKCYGQSSWGPTGFVFVENSKKRNELSKYLEKYINLNKMNEIRILKVEGRNFGKKVLTN